MAKINSNYLSKIEKRIRELEEHKKNTTDFDIYAMINIVIEELKRLVH